MEDRIITNKSYRVILLGVHEMVGENGLASILHYAGLSKFINNFPPSNEDRKDILISDATRLCESLADLFGIKGARALLFQVGRMIGKWGIEENMTIAQTAKQAMKSLSEYDKVKTMLIYTADTVSRQLETETLVEEEKGSFLYKDKASTYCFNSKSNEPVCHTAVGFLSEVVEWAVENRSWKIQEIECMAQGKPCCTYKVYKTN